ncbi:MAG: UDP-3-O-(3-hydroxymyristoyl)glucosamine N-acyltransferase [Phycisphaeraceae bacterium]|nr:UDP-3-O-(3-hydroxymyristoyl)glucosamine N-acyltransferase [Phycisphaeraceae bacterium]MCB9846997.1 UDP-3-O-(3-hydroxymyristoyl)glucosamine N-acyltransferase [Phycisphaeraceae bacterium]
MSPATASCCALTTTTGELAVALGAELVGRADLPLRRLETLDRADGCSLTFIRDERYASMWGQSAAAAAIVSRSVAVPGHNAAARALLIVEDADLALVRLLEQATPAHRGPDGGISDEATVHPDATIGVDVSIGPGVRVGAGAEIGDRVTINANAVVGAGARIGDDSDLRSGVVIEDRCVIGRGVTIHPNAVIGADGFGYRPADNGAGLVKVPHAGIVEIGDAVEIGACTTIDRGKLGATVIGAGTKIDNLVQIGHNCVIGRSCVICGATGIAGSVTIGDGVVIGGGAGVADNLTIGAGAKIGARSALMHDVPPGEDWVGIPAQPARQFMRIIAATQRLPELLRQFTGARGDES